MAVQDLTEEEKNTIRQAYDAGQLSPEQTELHKRSKEKGISLDFAGEGEDVSVPSHRQANQIPSIQEDELPIFKRPDGSIFAVEPLPSDLRGGGQDDQGGANG